VSTILKALERLEDEKRASSERSLDEQVVAARPPPDRERRGLKIGAVAIGGLAVAAAAFFFWPIREEPASELTMESPPPVTAPAAATKTKVAAEKPRRRSSARSKPAARVQQDSPEVEVSSVVEVVKHLDAVPDDSAEPDESSTRTALPAKPGDKRPARRPSGRKSKPEVARGATEPDSVQKEVVNAKPPDTQISGNSASAKPAQAPPAPVEVVAVAAKPDPVPPAPVEIAAVAPKPAPIEAPASVPAAIRQPEQKFVQRAKLPALSIEKTIWHPDADRRVAIVKLVDDEEVLRLKEGDAVGPLVIKTINPGSVLFNHDSIEIVYNVGS
jgi:hypothetical protein